ncbi:unnamed protein product [Blepharisma stoltei]|uniref:Uncharacterized protein n=1 Tax=Blepharisma stoltei TaxID=1481888 RepID=A0AAU9IKP2_9CILI|nr:unnamed protein product [Blepharisma stoltei]
MEIYLVKIKMPILSINLCKLYQLVKSIAQMKGDFIFRRKKDDADIYYLQNVRALNYKYECYISKCEWRLIVLKPPAQIGFSTT